MKRQKKWFTVFVRLDMRGIGNDWALRGDRIFTIGTSVLFVRLDMRGDRINYSNFRVFVTIGLLITLVLLLRLDEEQTGLKRGQEKLQ